MSTNWSVEHLKVLKYIEDGNASYTKKFGDQTGIDSQSFEIYAHDLVSINLLGIKSEWSKHGITFTDYYRTDVPLPD